MESCLKTILFMVCKIFLELFNCGFKDICGLILTPQMEKSEFEYDAPASHKDNADKKVNTWNA